MNSRAVLFLCGIGFTVRVIFSVFFNPGLIFPDEHRFWQEAVSIISGEGLHFNGVYAHDMPVTAMLIAGVLLIVGESIFAVKIVFAAVSSITIYLIAKLSYACLGCRHAALIAAAICTFYPFFIFYSSLLLSETIFLMFFVAFFLLVVDSEKVRPFRLGVTTGLMHLTKPVMVYLLPVIWIWQCLSGRVAISKLAVSVVVFLLVIAPWGIRNYFVIDSFVVTTASSGQVLWEGNNPWNLSGGVSGSFSNSSAYLEGVPEGLTEVQEDRWKKSQAVNYIMQYPQRFAVVGAKKFLRFWSLWPNTPEYQDWYYKALSVGSFGIVLMLAVVGGLVLTKERKIFSLFLLTSIYFTALHVVTIGSIRYRLPLEALLIVMASATCWHLVKKAQKRRKLRGQGRQENRA